WQLWISDPGLSAGAGNQDGNLGPELRQIIAPPLMHSDALIPVGAPVVCTPYRILVGMCERAFDSIGAPFPALVQERGRGRPQTMRRHFPNRVAHPPECLVHCVFAHRAPRGVERREGVAVGTCELPQLGEVVHYLA